jgi:hypothetical protein
MKDRLSKLGIKDSCTDIFKNTFKEGCFYEHILHNDIYIAVYSAISGFETKITFAQFHEIACKARKFFGFFNNANLNKTLNASAEKFISVWDGLDDDFKNTISEKSFRGITSDENFSEIFAEKTNGELEVKILGSLAFLGWVIETCHGGIDKVVFGEQRDITSK